MSEFWQMQLDEDSQKFFHHSPFHSIFHHSWQRSVQLDHVAHRATGKSSQFSKTHGRSSLQHSQCSGLLVHPQTPTRNTIEVQDKVLARLHKNHLKINLENCVFVNKEVSSHQKESIQAKTSWRQSMMQNYPQISRWSGPSWAFATSSGLTSRILRWLQHHYFDSHGKIRATNPDLCQIRLYRHSTIYRSN